MIVRTQYKNKIDNESLTLLAAANTQDLIKEISIVEKPTEWLNIQISSLHQLLISKLKNNTSDLSVTEIQSIIENCAEAKKMIDANVNAKFVLSNLIFSINPNVKS